MTKYNIDFLAKIRLLGTDGCHLCHEAMVLCEQTLGYLPAEIEITDFADVLYNLYEVRIPVLAYIPDTSMPLAEIAGSDLELAWPFDDAALENFLDKHSQTLC
jgi:hypothetical protein